MMSTQVSACARLLRCSISSTGQTRNFGKRRDNVLSAVLQRLNSPFGKIYGSFSTYLQGVGEVEVVLLAFTGPCLAARLTAAVGRS